MKHTLKLQERFFEDVASGIKSYEIRRNDRNFQVGDTLVLQEWHPSTGYSGREATCEVTYMTDHNPPAPLPAGIVVMAITKPHVSRTPVRQVGV